MTDLKREESGARPSSGRAFLKRQPFVLPGLKAQLVFWPLMTIGLALDLWSKSAVFDWLQQRNSVSIIDGFLQIVAVENAGAAFGIAIGRHYLLAFSVIALIVIFTIFLFSTAGPISVHIALGLLAAGVCGNFYDRIFNAGSVRDFIDVAYWPGRHWPAFNIADTMLCVGVGLLIISGFLSEKSARRRARKHR